MFSNRFVYFDFAFSRHDLWSVAKGTPQDVQGGIEIAIDELIVSVGGTAPQQASHGRFRPFAPPFLYFLKHGVCKVMDCCRPKLIDHFCWKVHAALLECSHYGHIHLALATRSKACRSISHRNATTPIGVLDALEEPSLYGTRDGALSHLAIVVCPTSKRIAVFLKLDKSE